MVGCSLSIETNKIFSQILAISETNEISSQILAVLGSVKQNEISSQILAVLTESKRMKRQKLAVLEA